MSVVYSYIRFSSRKQEQGDSVRRQASMGAAWMAKHPEHVLDETLKLQDLGKSAFRGANLDKDSGNLGKFVALAKDGKIPSGSILMLENLDRYTRLTFSKAIRAFCELVEAGVKVLVLESGQLIDKSNIDTEAVVYPVVANLLRSHEESDRKSRLLSAKWQAKRAKARADGTPVMRRGPCWLTWDGAKWQVKPGAKEAIEFIYTRTCDGIGQTRLLQELQDEYKPFVGKHWQASLLADILRRRTVLGEFVPCRRSAKPQEPIADYFPRLISDELWYRARAASTCRKYAKGKSSEFVNLFLGLGTFPDKSASQIQTNCRNKSDGKRIVTRYLVSAGHRDRVKGACPLMVEYGKVERHVLGVLYQLSGKDLQPGEEPDHAGAKRAEIAAIEARLNELVNKLDNSTENIDELSGAITRQKAKRDECRKDLASLEFMAARHKAQPLQEAQTVLEALESATDAEQHDLRLKLRALLASIIKEIRIDPYRVEGKTEAKIYILGTPGHHHAALDTALPVADPRQVRRAVGKAISVSGMRNIQR